MELKSILVAVGRGPSAQAAIKGAAALARSHGAHLLGLHVIDVAPFVSYVDTDVPAQVLEIQRERLHADAVATEAVFKQITEQSGVDSLWHCVEGRTHHVIDLHARYYDLVCASGPATVDDGFGVLPIAEELVFSTGRAVLIIPQNFDATSIGEHVTVAWNGSREAAKAVSYAMAILSHAQKVSMVTVMDNRLNETQATTIAADMSQYLDKHSVVPHAQTVSADGVAAGQFLHDWARGQGSDLLVMGAYGHTRIREFILGGVTRWSLRNTTIPILMAH